MDERTVVCYVSVLGMMYAASPEAAAEWAAYAAHFAFDC